MTATPIDALAATVKDLAELLSSDSRGLALRRALLAGPREALPLKVLGVAEGILGPLRGALILPKARVSSTLHAEDGTTKWALEFGDGQSAETVLIP